MTTKHKPLLRSVALFALPALIVVSALAGCRSDSWHVDNDRALLLGDHSLRHEIGLSERTETMHVEVRRGAPGLSANQEDDVDRFLQQYRQQGVGPLRIGLPPAARDQDTARQALRGLRMLIGEAGIPSSAVEIVRAKGHQPAVPALTVSFSRPQAIPPVCGDYPDDLGVNHSRVNHADHGCATQRALAVMTANSRDLMTPQQESPRPSERRATIWSGYTKGGGKAAGGGGADGGNSKSEGKK